MKTNLTRLKAFLLAAVLCCLGKLSTAQSFECYIANDHLISPTVYQFEIWMNPTGADFNFRTIQVGLQFNAAFIPAGATITGSTVFGTTQLVGGYTTGAPQWNGT